MARSQWARVQDARRLVAVTTAASQSMMLGSLVGSGSLLTVSLCLAFFHFLEDRGRWAIRVPPEAPDAP